MDTIIKVEASKELFAGDYNCAQSVIKALSDVAGLEDYLSEALMAGFGGGVGGHQEICGAVSGASLAISHAVFGLYEDRSAGKDEARAAVGEFVADFKQAFGNVRCYDLTGYDFSIDEEKEAFVETGTKDKVCMKGVEYAVKSAIDIIESRKSNF